MEGMLRYKNYFGSVSYSDEDKIFYGKVEFIRSLISYEGGDVKSLEKAFQESVSDYLDLCEQQRKVPEQPFKGSFNVRTGSNLHRRTALYAKEHNMNLNNVVAEALEKYLSNNESKK